MERTQRKREWVVIHESTVLYRGTSCYDAVKLIERDRLDPGSLFVASDVARLLPEMLPKTQ